ncbi:carboxylic acid transporter protein [Agrocybe pediades]|nr:carboxylic acid transporter protein [Agrocybe pediades]
MAPYFLQNLIPRGERHENARPLLVALREVTWVQWGLYFSGWLSWTCDSIDFFSVSLSVTHLEAQFNRSTHDITTAITLTLLFRSVGGIIFGVISDRYGRKWPLIANLVFIAILELGCGFVQTYKQFLAVRSLFGIGMGGVWGMAASNAMENLPVEVRGIASGFLQEGYAVGYMIAAVINLFLVPEVGAGWRSLFWAASGISLFAAFVRLLLPESAMFLRANAIEASMGHDSSKKTKVFIQEIKLMLKKHWLLCIYGILFMTGFNFISHGSQDLYPTFLTVSKGLSNRDSNIAIIIGNCGAVAGGVFAGWSSQYIGRRLSIIVQVIIVGAFIPLWILPTSFRGLAIGAFCIQFGVQGSLGVIPIQLAEMGPPAFRATFAGLVYQAGNMISAASAQIEATGGEHLRKTVVQDGKLVDVPDYATVQGILIGATAAYTIIITILGPENHSSRFEKHKTAFEEGAADDEDILAGKYEVTIEILSTDGSSTPEQKQPSISKAEIA